MDIIDRKILSYIQHFGRESYAQIGAAVDLSISAVNERLKKLQSQGVIEGWSATINPQMAGTGILCFIFVALDTPEGESAFKEAVTSWPAVQECHHVTGDWSYLLKVRVSEIGGIEKVLGQLKRLPGVSRTHSMIGLSSPKDSRYVPCLPEEMI